VSLLDNKYMKHSVPDRWNGAFTNFVKESHNYSQFYVYENINGTISYQFIYLWATAIRQRTEPTLSQVFNWSLPRKFLLQPIDWVIWRDTTGSWSIPRHILNIHLVVKKRWIKINIPIQDNKYNITIFFYKVIKFA